MSPDTTGPANPSRRRAIRLLALCTAGAGLALVGADAIFSSKPGGSISSQTSVLTAAPTTRAAGQAQSANLRVKVRYFQMAGALPGVQQEFFVLERPARFGQLLEEVVGEHPVIAGMMPTMLVLVDGLVAEADTPLDDGDEVDFIPTVSGG